MQVKIFGPWKEWSVHNHWMINYDFWYFKNLFLSCLNHMGEQFDSSKLNTFYQKTALSCPEKFTQNLVIGLQSICEKWKLHVFVWHTYIYTHLYNTLPLISSGLTWKYLWRALKSWPPELETESSQLANRKSSFKSVHMQGFRWLFGKYSKKYWFSHFNLTRIMITVVNRYS